VKVKSFNSYGRLDGLFALVMALGSVVYGNSARVPAGGMHKFLEMRITVLNAAFAGLFMLAWIYCFRALNLYGAGAGTISRKLLRIAKGCALMTGLQEKGITRQHEQQSRGRGNQQCQSRTNDSHPRHENQHER